MNQNRPTESELMDMLHASVPYDGSNYQERYQIGGEWYGHRDALKMQELAHLTGTPIHSFVTLDVALDLARRIVSLEARVLALGEPQTAELSVGVDPLETAAAAVKSRPRTRGPKADT